VESSHCGKQLLLTTTVVFQNGLLLSLLLVICYQLLTFLQACLPYAVYGIAVRHPKSHHQQATSSRISLPPPWYQILIIFDSVISYYTSSFHLRLRTAATNANYPPKTLGFLSMYIHIIPQKRS
jgi:hypothetical protein